MYDDFKFKLNIKDALANQVRAVTHNVPNNHKKLEEAIRRKQDELKEREKRRNEYEQKNIELLTEMNDSLKNIDDIVYLLSKSVDHQEETLELLTEIFSIGTAPDKEIALSRFQKVYDKINTINEHAETFKNFMGLATQVYLKTTELLNKMPQ